jgi:hypothetical protein
VSIILLVCFFKIICLGLFLFQNFETKQINKIIIVHLDKKDSLVHIAPACAGSKEGSFICFE